MELKFRVWYKTNNKMYSRSIESINFETRKLGIYLDSKEYRQLPLSDFEIMHYSWITDKNGKEIYENDIIRDNNNQLWEVKFTDGKFIVKNRDLSKTKDLIQIYPFYFCEVIGNTYDMPDWNF